MAFSNFTSTSSQVIAGGGASMEFQSIDIDHDGWLDIVMFCTTDPYTGVDQPMIVLKNLKNGTFAKRPDWIQAVFPGMCIHARR